MFEVTPALRSVLFVHDDPGALRQIKNDLKDRKGWSLMGCTTADEALDLMEKMEFDAVIAKADLPEMDGVQLLTMALIRFPTVIRVISAPGDQMGSLMKGIAPCQQFLALPWEAEDVEDTIEHSVEIREYFDPGSLGRLLSGLSKTPSLPKVYFEIQRLLQIPNASLRHVGVAIAKDPGLTAKLVSLVNSGLFGVTQAVACPMQATALLGQTRVQALVCVCQMLSQFDLSMIPSFSEQAFERHAAMVGAFARIIALEEGLSPAVAERAVLAGCLHSLGHLILAENLGSRYRSILAYAEGERVSPWRVEEKVLGTNYGKITAYLLALWGFPKDVLEAIAYHNNPSEARNHHFGLLHVVHAAQALDHKINPQYCLCAPTRFDGQLFEGLGKHERFEHWLELCQEAIMGSRLAVA